MTTNQPDIMTLSRERGNAHTPVPAPSRRWLTRVGVPLIILIAAGGLLVYAARDALAPAIEVRVAPVVLKETTTTNAAPRSAAQTTVVAQGPGWIEPMPHAISVQALAEGVIEEVLTLEGDRVERGQVVARMIDDDARLAVLQARAREAQAAAEVERADAAALAANARADELRDELERKQPLVEAGGFSEGQFARLILRLRAAQHEERAASAAVDSARAALAQAEAMRGEAELRLSRMEIRSPASGVVMTRAVEPGTRIAMAGPGPGEGHAPGLFRLYNPEHLQVRVDVPLADAAKVRVGSNAEVTTEALPDRVFRGEVIRAVHEADIQRNTVEVKVKIIDPDPVLKPEMLARVRFFATSQPGEQPASTTTTQSESSALVQAPFASLFGVHEDTASVWVVDRGSERGGATAAIRAVTLAGRDGEGALISAGLRPGDRVILNPPPSLKVGARVRTAPSEN